LREDFGCNCAEEKYAADGKRKLQKDERIFDAGCDDDDGGKDGSFCE
jgi:hypothetical protein